jgi:hypothetical protein
VAGLTGDTSYSGAGGSSLLQSADAAIDGLVSENAPREARDDEGVCLIMLCLLLVPLLLLLLAVARREARSYANGSTEEAEPDDLREKEEREGC